MTLHTFDQRSWRIIKDFVGIYDIKMDYTKITKLSKDKISKAYFEHAKLPIEPFEVSIVYRAKYNQNGKIISLAPDTPSGTRPFDKSIKEWKALILKKAAQGYKNREFYEALAKWVAPPPKVTCICGLKMGWKSHQQDAHFRTRNHINRMLQCVPLSKVADLKVPVCDRAWVEDWTQRSPAMGNSHTLVVRKWSNHQRQFLVKQIDLRPYMEQRDINQAQIYNYLSSGGFDTSLPLPNKMKKQLNWERTYYTMDDILAGGWVPGW